MHIYLVIEHRLFYPLNKAIITDLSDSCNIFSKYLHLIIISLIGSLEGGN